MINDLLRLLEDHPVISHEMRTNFNRTATKIRQQLKPFLSNKEALQVEVLAENSVKYSIEFKHWMRPEEILDMHNVCEQAIRGADINGHIQAIEEGNSTGEHFVEAMLSGLRPGMKLKVEAFYPTMEKIVTWKVVTSRKK